MAIGIITSKKWKNARWLLDEFDPHSVGDLQLWFRADGGTLYQDTGGTTPADQDGDRIALWENEGLMSENLTDQSGNPKARPLYVSNSSIGNKPSVEFNPDNNPDSPVTTRSLTMEPTFENNWPTEEATFIIVGIRDNQPPETHRAGCWEFSPNSFGDHIPYSDGNFYLGTLKENRTTIGDSDAEANLSMLNPFMVTVQHISTTGAEVGESDWTAYINQIQEATSAGSTNVDLGIGVLGVSVGGEAYGGRFSELLIYSNYLDSTALAEVEQYLIDKYSLSF